MRRHFLSLVIPFLVVSLFFRPAESETGHRSNTSPLNLYKVFVGSRLDAEALDQSKAAAIAIVSGGYLVLATADQAERLSASGLDCFLIATGVERGRLALDNRHDRFNIGRYPLVYEEGRLRLYLVDSPDLFYTTRGLGLTPLPAEGLPIFYREPGYPGTWPDIESLELDSLIDKVSQDSLESYSAHLQAYGDRAVGTSSCYTSAIWMANKLAGFGYDSVVVDAFYALVEGRRIKCLNVLAYKVGTVYPYCHIIVGAHRDTSYRCPGANDNGSGTAGVLEIARVLSDIDTRMTVVLALFDAEEAGLFGSEEYVNKAYAVGQPIILMQNMDMIANYLDDSLAHLMHGGNDAFCQLWAELASSLESIGITADFEEYVGASDHAPFLRKGYEAFWINEHEYYEYIHTPQDSTVYLNFDYMTRMVKATLATAVVVDSTVTPPPGFILTITDSIPSMIRPDATPPVSVHVRPYGGGQLVPGGVKLNCVIDGMDTVSQPMTAIGGDVYSGEFPPIACGSYVEFYVSADEAAGGTFYNPDLETPFKAIVATSKIVLFEDDFSTDKGWTVFGGALDGHWERSRVEECSWPHNVIEEYDSSGYCYVTGCDFSNVDDGETCLKAPNLQSPPGDVFITYALFYTNSLGDNPNSDVFKIYLYNGGGVLEAYTFGPVYDPPSSWQEYYLRVNDYFTPVQPFSVRFDAIDTGGDSFVEAAIDAVKVIVYSYTPSIVTETLPEGTAGSPYLYELEASGCATPLAWTDKFDDLAGSGLTLSAEGLISGTPPDTGVFAFTAVVTDTAGYTDEQAYSLHIQIEYVCGDANRDGIVNVADAVYIINYVFKAGPVPVPLEAGDANADGAVNVADAVYLINYVFKNGPGPICP